MPGAKKLDRRTVLRGVGIAGISIALPPLEAMLNSRGQFYSVAGAQAAAQPKRLVVFHWPQGVPGGWNGGDYWCPTNGSTALTLSEGLQPLAAFKDVINVVSGLSYGPILNHVGSHGHGSALLTGYQPSEPQANVPSAKGPSVDQVAAKKIGTSTKFSSIETGFYSQDEVRWSWSAANTPVTLEFKPKNLFNRIFADANLDPDAAALAAQRAKSVLDYVQSDIQALQKRLGIDDRTRLDAHLTSIRELEKSVTTPISAECALPGQPMDVPYTDGQCTEYAQLMIDLVTMALRCDLTRVAFMSLGPTQNYRTFPHLNIPYNYHNICHSGGCEAGAPCLDTNRSAAVSYYKQICTWHMEQVAYILERLSTADPTGATLLDNSAFIALSEFNEGGTHLSNYLPVIVAGKIGNMATGKNLMFPCQDAEDFKMAQWCKNLSGTPNRCINDLWQSALQGVGALQAGEKFGDPAINTKPLEGLWV